LDGGRYDTQLYVLISTTHPPLGHTHTASRYPLMETQLSYVFPCLPTCSRAFLDGWKLTLAVVDGGSSLQPRAVGDRSRLGCVGRWGVRSYTSERWW